MAVAEERVAEIYAAILRNQPSDAQVEFYAAFDTEEDVIAQLLVAAEADVVPVIELYQAALGRLPDSAGLDFWVGRYRDISMSSGSAAALSALALGFAGEDETIQLYAGLSNPEIVAQLYTNILGRGSDDAGFDFWVGRLDAGAELGEVINGFSASAEFDARAEPFIEAFLRGIADDEDDDSDEYEGDLFDVQIPVGQNPGSTFTLQVTGGGVPADNLTGTDRDDLFRGPTANSLETEDTITGGGGNDTLRATLDGTTPSPVMTGVESAFITSVNNPSGLDLEQVSGLQVLWSDESDSDFTAANASTAILFGASDTTAATAYNIELDSTAASGQSTVNLAVDDVNANTVTFNFDDQDGATVGTQGGVETVTLDARGGTGSGTTGDNANDDVVLGATTDIETLKVTGSGNLTVTANSTGLETYDASGASGRITADLSASTEDLKATGGSGADTITVGSGDNTIVGGAGGDTLNGGTGDDIFGGGAGNDTVNLAAGGNDEVHVDAGVGLDTVNGFTAALAGTINIGPDAIAGTADDFADVNAAAEVDVVSFLQGGAITFANSTDDSGRGDSDLDSADFQVRASLSDTTTGDDQKVVILQDSFAGDGASTIDFTTGQLTGGFGAAAEFYLVAQNSDTGNAEIYYDDNWSDISGRQLIVSLTGVDVDNLTNANFDIYV